jgi:2-polyprenyl-3-methyl-5-hydroxy-6-metoxy-1,4-benzoquinol methylase
MYSIQNCPVCNSVVAKDHLKCTDYTASGEEFNLKICNECSFCITTPRPIDLSKYYISEDYISHSSKARSLFDHIYVLARKFAIKNKFQLVQSYLESNGTPSILDVGCGTGEFLKYCSSKNWRVSGVEPSEKALKAASNLSFEIYSSIAEVNHSFNLITLWHVLEHIPELNTTLQNLRNLLKDNGTIFIAVPNFNSYDAQHYKSFWAGYDVPRHLWHFSKSSMQKTLDNNGLKLVRVLPMKMDSFYVSLLSEKYSNNNRLNLYSIIKAIRIGLKSNNAALKNNEYSSLIYVIKK